MITIATLGLRKADRFLLLPKSAGASEEEASEEGEDDAASEDPELSDEDSEDAPESPVEPSVEPKNRNGYVSFVILFMDSYAFFFILYYSKARMNFICP